jgi:hypothetical protein
MGGRRDVTSFLFIDKPPIFLFSNLQKFRETIPFLSTGVIPCPLHSCSSSRPLSYNSTYIVLCRIISMKNVLDFENPPKVDVYRAKDFRQSIDLPPDGIII